MDFFDLGNIHFILAFFLSIANAALLCLIAGKFLQILQLSGYKIKGYNVWLKDTKARYISRIAMLSFLSLACVLVTNALFDVYHQDSIYSYLGLIFYIYFSIVFIIHMVNSPQKTPLAQTRRMARLISCLFILCVGITFVLIWVCTEWLYFIKFGVIVLTPLLLPVLVPLAHFIMLPLETFIRWNYIRKAKKKLASRPDLIRIGITGSYAKTSVKHILFDMLSEKYNVCMSPHSFNTPMGLTKVVLKYLKPENQILIAEMGAKQVGDIAYLCNIINPQHAIITGIGSQHLETFGSVENIKKTKNELVLALPENANVVFNMENKGARELFEECTLKNKFLAGFGEESELKVSNVDITSNGMTFTLEYNGKSKKCTSNLIGKHNLENILLSATLALKVGVSLEGVARAISELQPVAHRLEVIRNQNITVLDDAFNSSVEGSTAAVEVLSSFKDSVKICITPGMVEMGQEEFNVNEHFGEQLGKVCDYVIVVNKVNQEALKKGLESTEIAKENIILVDTLKQAKARLNELITPDKNYVVLFENDLPDNYT
ncbi:MAG TPA: UDP-N-acetylmuramoyl-tripeptide--D-alanyl-D-alanine ligase [Candidatus Caccopulliclostridium gallistercoris]|uniref:UDP-N-acetylmuramoyl-tripeptide--D-alanyl-D-alanine ligase n=1 Tax=Candidatus Caccopulliclostridium gallistercoris TaxID=2840719 RepID=A0A9D1NDZ2_9FIRM|nr:UDP-N-acetylmuramoyl-tripeptide--D-alanyl-D-alanine ligase [Candidatus Caccopulliclostridium gallistercoris]